MNIPGRIQNGVIVFDDDISLPEGVVVSVSDGTPASIQVAGNQKRVEFRWSHRRSPEAFT